MVLQQSIIPQLPIFDGLFHQLLGDAHEGFSKFIALWMVWAAHDVVNLIELKELLEFPVLIKQIGAQGVPWVWQNFADVSNRLGCPGTRLAGSTSFHSFADVITYCRPKHRLPGFQHTFFHSLVTFMYLLQGFPLQSGRYENLATFSCNSIFNGHVFPIVPIVMEFLWKLSSLTRPSIWNVVHQQLECRILPHFLTDLVQIIGTAWNVHHNLADCNYWQLNSILFHR